MTSSLMRTYASLSLSFSHGEGVYLWGNDGNQYLDALGGIAVNGLGHAHPRLVETISNQATRLMHVSNIYQIPEQEQLGKRLCELSGMERVFFANSGAEANEAAIKLARLHGHSKDIDSPQIIVAEQAFHGRTLATLTATGNSNIQQGFEPLMPGFIRVAYDDTQALEHVAAQHSNIVAVLLEPIQGEGGIHIPQHGYLSAVRKLCDQHDWLMMLDEVQTGNGRTGKWFAYQHEDLLPDVVSTAKALGNGYPIGACMARGKAAEVFGPGNHGSTYGGNPMACSVAHTVLDVIAEDGLLDNTMQRSEQILSGLQRTIGGVDGVSAIRGKGLMIGIELDRPCAELVARAAEQEQLLINVTAGQVVRLLPPLVLSAEQADVLVEKLARLIRTFLTTTAAE